MMSSHGSAQERVKVGEISIFAANCVFLHGFKKET